MRLSSTTTMPCGETYTGATLVDMYLSEIAALSGPAGTEPDGRV